MPIFRIQHQSFYTCISNAALRDSRLSLGARGLHHLLLSNSDEWDISINSLASQNKEGRTAIAKYLNELEDLGYLEREQSRSSGTFSRTIYTVKELPDGTMVNFKGKTPVIEWPDITVVRKTDHGDTVSRFADHGDTVDGSTDHGKPAHIEITIDSSTKNQEVKKERNKSDFVFFDSPNNQVVPTPARGSIEQRAIAHQSGHSPRMPGELIDSGLEEIWVGPRPNNFDTRLEQYVIKRLGKSNYYTSRGEAPTLGDARKHLGGLIKTLDFVTLQTYWDEAIAIGGCHNTGWATETRTLNQQIRDELVRLNRNGVLPTHLRVDGKELASDLDDNGKLEFLDWLRNQEVAVS